MTLGGEVCQAIRDVDRLPPFLMSVVSHSDHWLFVSSRGGLTAGRRSPAGALFPYVTDDKLHTCHAHTGPQTTLRVLTPNGPRVWEPFRHEHDDPQIHRHLYKSALATQVIFEEVHDGLGLRFRARWSSSEKFGFVRTVSLENLGPAPCSLELADGLVDLMPAGVAQGLQQSASCLVNAYTRADVDPRTRLGLIALQAAIVDQPVAAEALRATTVFCTGLPGFEVLLCTDQLAALRRGQPVHAEATLTGRRAAYLVKAALTIAPGQTSTWRLVADVERDHVQVEALRARLAQPEGLDAELDADIAQGTAALRRNVGSADGLQQGGDPRVVVHHYANVLFNNMRGGVFVAGHQVSWLDFAVFLGERNRALAERFRPALAQQSGQTTVGALRAWTEATGDPDLLRLAHEYLPLAFSRRHGDPSRPWNAFAIRLRNPDGSSALDYQGNWRDIFQNWEALCTSHPGFLENVIATFVNASTADGFNPYRLSRAGIDWEVPEEGNPWATIGYWGDHQIVYLGRLLEQLEHTHPGRLGQLLTQRWFTFADVPYRLTSARDIARDPRSTIRFDHAAHRRSTERAAKEGGDGKLLHHADGSLVRASLLEKLLVPVLAKLANLVLDGGIWMNTQRPEWNDANNALVGDGLSMVTMAQLRRHLVFLGDLFERAGEAKAELSASVSEWLTQTRRVLDAHLDLLSQPAVSDQARRTLLDELQWAFQGHRDRLTGAGLGEAAPVPIEDAAALCRTARRYVEHSLRANRRADGLYHSYNLLRLAPGAAKVEPLYEMLEGQVAVISCGLLTATESLEVIDALFRSRLFRADQESFLLYPDRALPGFLEKNRVPQADVASSPLLAALVQEGDVRLVAKDVRGDVRFAGRLHTVEDVRAAVGELGHDPRFSALARDAAGPVVAIFERVFDLQSFTGRSGTMYGYEGLGCIYWHMVSKLLLAVQEVHAAALRANAAPEVIGQLARAYHRVRGGLGFNKSPQRFGAFPGDPYSHTPRHAGAQQPGMTGSVKEEVLTRLGELGVQVRQGALHFHPTLLSSRELLTAPAPFTWFDVAGTQQERTLQPGELGFTLCQVPIIYRVGATRSLEVRWADGTVQQLEGSALEAKASRAVLGRTGEVREVMVSILSTDPLTVA
ncbi:MAG: hypothetical protein Q8L48_06040 [Archangium sp.]|nr:hypothetical protein [Archangium sp.]